MGQNRQSKRSRTKMTICSFNARMLASEACVEDLMMHARKIKYDAIGLTETSRHCPLHALFETGEELFLGTCDSRSIGGVGVLVNTHLAMDIDSYESLTTRIGCLRLRRCGSRAPLTIFVDYATTSSYEEDELEVFQMDLERLYREDRTFFKVKVGDFNPKIGPRRTAEELHIGTHSMEWNEQDKRLSEFIMSTNSINGTCNSRSYENTHEKQRHIVNTTSVNLQFAIVHSTLVRFNSHSLGNADTTDLRETVLLRNSNV
ncbi:hypothetical protein V3C99_018702 [Haemonchus contortus]